jgi:uncharacterized protein (TIGR01619 family)
MSNRFVIAVLLGSVLIICGVFVIYMGIFSKLYGAKEVDNKAQVSADQASRPEENWVGYLSNVDGVIGSIVVDLAIRKIAPAIDKPNVAWVFLNVNNPNSNGFPGASEMVELDNIEETLALEITSKINAVYVGHLNSDGRRDVYFYIGDPSAFKSTVSDSMSGFPDHQAQFDWKNDENWEGYLEFLYPRPRQMQSIENRKVISVLEENGDKLTKERPVEHWIYFKSENGRNQFLSMISGKNFQVLDESYDANRGALPFGLQISRVDKVDQENIDEYTLFLWETANECDGDYDGWETMVLKD